jgi:hypothetical protein
LFLEESFGVFKLAIGFLEEAEDVVVGGLGGGHGRGRGLQAQGARGLGKTIDGAREGPRRRAQGARWLEKSIDGTERLEKATI